MSQYERLFYNCNCHKHAFVKQIKQQNTLASCFKQQLRMLTRIMYIVDGLRATLESAEGSVETFQLILMGEM